MKDKIIKIKEKAIKSARFVVPGFFFFAILNIFFKSFGFSINAIVSLLVVAILSALWITKYKPLPIILTTLLSAGSVAFLLTIGQNDLQKYYIVFVSVLFTVALFSMYRFFTPREEKPQEEKIKLIDSGFNLNQSIVMFAIFLTTSGIYGIYTIINIETWQMMIFIFLSIYLATYYLIRINFIKSQELELHLDYYRNRTFNFYSFLMGLTVLELAWAMTFLPINHLTFGAVILATYFSFWNIIKKYLRNELTKRKFINHMTFLLLATIFIIATSRLSIS